MRIHVHYAYRCTYTYHATRDHAHTQDTYANVFAHIQICVHMYRSAYTCIHVSLYMCIHIYIYIHAHMHQRVYKYIYLHICKHILTLTHSQTQARLHIRTRMSTIIHPTCTCADICTYAYPCVYTYARTRTHTEISVHVVSLFIRLVSGFWYSVSFQTVDR